MSFITYPLNNIDYMAEDAELFHCTRTSGVYARESFFATVSGIDNNITIGKGIAWIKNGEFSGKVTAQKDSETLDLGLADASYPRIDAVVLQFNANSNAVSLVVKNGTAKTNPAPPEIVRNANVYELHLYHILRPAGAVSVTASNVTDLRMNAEYCGLMADSVTEIDTTAINAQATALIQRLKTELDEVERGSGIMTQLAYTTPSDAVAVSKGGTGGTSPLTARINLGIQTGEVAFTFSNSADMTIEVHFPSAFVDAPLVDVSPRHNSNLRVHAKKKAVTENSVIIHCWLEQVAPVTVYVTWIAIGNVPTVEPGDVNVDIGGGDDEIVGPGGTNPET